MNLIPELIRLPGRHEHKARARYRKGIPAARLRYRPGGGVVHGGPDAHVRAMMLPATFPMFAVAMANLLWMILLGILMAMEKNLP
jgi:hypothetical protein